MLKHSLTIALVLLSTAGRAQDFVQCWSDHTEAPEQIVRINIDQEQTTSDADGNERIGRATMVAVGMDVVLATQASGTVSDQLIEVTLINDDFIVGSIKAAALEGHPYLMRGEIRAEGTRNDGSSVRLEKTIECVRHSLSN